MLSVRKKLESKNAKNSTQLCGICEVLLYQELWCLKFVAKEDWESRWRRSSALRHSNLRGGSWGTTKELLVAGCFLNRCLRSSRRSREWVELPKEWLSKSCPLGWLWIESVSGLSMERRWGPCNLWADFSLYKWIQELRSSSLTAVGMMRRTRGVWTTEAGRVWGLGFLNLLGTLGDMTERDALMGVY